METSLTMQAEFSPAILPIGGLSHVRGATTIPLSEQTVPALLAQTVAAFPEREAVVFLTRNPRSRVARALSTGQAALPLQASKQS